MKNEYKEGVFFYPSDGCLYKCAGFHDEAETFLLNKIRLNIMNGDKPYFVVNVLLDNTKLVSYNALSKTYRYIAPWSIFHDEWWGKLVHDFDYKIN